MPTNYEIQRQENIARNKRLLQGLKEKDVATGVPRPQPKPTKTVGRKSTPAKPKKRVERTSDDEIEDFRPMKRVRPEIPQSGLRRSQRNAGKEMPDYQDHDRDPRRPTGKRIHDPKTFGHIPGVEVGTWWESREDCSNDAIHAPWVAGISGSDKGAYSVALSGGYEDDVDMGDYFTFTGSGGRALRGTKTNPKNLRTAPQSSDQSFEHSFNKALKISSETRKPVRVIRGFKLSSPYAPFEGYDGLYTVEKAWMEEGLNDGGYLVCKFAFRRVPGQPPLQVKDEGEADDGNGSDEDSASSTA
ncbi:PUA-like domain-containing protein [Lactarius quietus]|nr:PUA-like domain-containing protein [Lactarius quietus]